MLVSAIIVGLLPAWQATRRASLTEDLGDGKGALSGSLKPWMRQLLIGAQAAIVMIVLSGAALLVRSAINLQQEPIGFDTQRRADRADRVAGGAVRIAERVARGLSAGARARGASPGVRFAALDSQAPLVDARRIKRPVRPRAAKRRRSDPVATSHFVTPDYFTVLNIPLKAGRTFTDATFARRRS